MDKNENEPKKPKKFLTGFVFMLGYFIGYALGSKQKNKEKEEKDIYT